MGHWIGNMQSGRLVVLPLLVIFSLAVVLPVSAEDSKAVAPAAVAPAKIAPAVVSGEALKIQQTIEQLFVASRGVNKPAEAMNKNRKLIESSLDWNRIASDCLGKAASKGTAAQREEFKNLLKDVAVKTAYSRLDTFWNGTQYVFDVVEVKGSEGHVRTVFTVDSDTFALDYYLSNSTGRWLITDIAFKKERYTVNIHEQVSDFLGQGKFATLLDKLKKRRAELEPGVVSSTAAKPVGG